MKSKYLIMLLLVMGYLTTINGQYEIKAAETAEQLRLADESPKYLPMYETGRRWVWRTYKIEGSDTTISTREEMVVSDTLIANKIHKKILFQEYNPFYNFGYDEDGIIFRGEINNIVPFYKFDVEENDTLIYFYSEPLENNEYDVSYKFMDFKVDSIRVNDIVRKRISFSWDDVDMVGSYWIEGIGAFNAEPLVIFPSHACGDWDAIKYEELEGCYDGDECIFTHADASAPGISDNSIHGVKRKLSRGQSNVATSDTNIVKLSYDDKYLSVELISWERRDYVYNMWPRAYVDNDVIRIVPDIVNYDDAKILMHHNPDYIDVVRYYDVSFSFPGIEPGRYTVMLMSDDGKEVQSTYELDLTDGFSKQFPDDPSYDGAIEISNLADITFDGTLVEFSSDGNATLELFTTEGVRLARAEGSGAVRLSTGELMPGIYVVRATAADGRTARRKIAVK